jgi:hypothetical protein
VNDTQAVNGQAPAAAPADIPFGDQPHERFSPMWAEGVLRELFQHHRETFGRCVMAYTTGIRHARRGRKPEASQ